MLAQVKPKYVYLKETKSVCNFNFKYTNTVLDIIDKCKYLSITLYYTGNFRRACKVFSEQAMT